jgi:tetratricopeptide (TPR) repeat protein
MSKKKKPAGTVKKVAPSPLIPEVSAKIRLGMALSLVLVGFLLYGKTLHAPFVLDDVHKIQTNPDIRVERLSQVFSKLVYPYAENPSFVRNDPSRPVTFLTYTLNYSFGKLDPLGYRFINLLGHVGVGLLLFWLTRRLFFLLFENEQVVISYLLALLYVVHPVNTIVALYTFNRADILAALTSIGTLLLFLGPKTHSRWRYGGALLLFILGLGSKQSVAILPFVLLVTDFVVAHRCGWASFRSRLRVHLPFWIILGIFFVARIGYFGALGDLEAESPWERGTYLITQFYSVVRYIQFVIFPVGLALDHMPKHFTSLADPVLLGSVAILAGLGVMVWVLVRRGTAASRLVLFATLWFVLQLAPTSSFLPTTTALAENRLYLAEYGILLLIVIGFCSLFRIDLHKRMTLEARWFSIVGLGLPLILVGGLAYNRGRLFSDPFALWMDVLRVYPNQPRAMYSLGVLHYENKDFDQALRFYEKTVALDPDYEEAHNNMGLIYANRGETEKSIEAFKKSVAAKPREKTYCNLGRAYTALKMYPEALAALERALSINPASAQAYTLIGRIAFDQGDLLKARENFDQAYRYAPHFHELRNNMALISLADKKYDEALGHLHQAIEAQPKFAEAHYNRAVVYARMGRDEQSRESFDQACSLDPHYIFKPVQPGGPSFQEGAFPLPPDNKKYLHSLNSPGQ